MFLYKKKTTPLTPAEASSESTRYCFFFFYLADRIHNKNMYLMIKNVLKMHTKLKKYL
jgi:hypothetical protein